MPKLMANRKPFDLRNTLVAYNLFQTVFSAWIFYEVSSPFHFILFHLIRFLLTRAKLIVTTVTAAAGIWHLHV